jgi:hypothetical protein
MLHLYGAEIVLFGRLTDCQTVAAGNEGALLHLHGGWTGSASCSARSSVRPGESVLTSLYTLRSVTHGSAALPTDGLAALSCEVPY